MVENARRLHPECTFEVASATELDLADSSLGGVLGWWSLFNLPSDVLPPVLSSFARALIPGGQLLIATHVGDDDLTRTEAYGGIPSVGRRTSGNPNSSLPSSSMLGSDPWPSCASPPTARAGQPWSSRRSATLSVR